MAYVTELMEAGTPLQGINFGEIVLDLLGTNKEEHSLIHTNPLLIG
jgi:hypothetical protein